VKKTKLLNGIALLPEETLSAQQLQAKQARAWATTYAYVFEHSPFYREHFRKAGLSRRDPLPLEQLAQIPPIDKTALSANPAAFLCVPETKVVDIVTTSGSTGEPLMWKLTEADLQRLAWNEYLSFRCAGLSEKDTVALAVAMDRCFIAGMAYFLGLRQLGCGILRLGPSAPLMHLGLIQRAQPSAIVGVPSFLGLLADKAVESGFDLAALGIRKAVCIGEPVRNQDFTVNQAATKIERSFACKVFSTYGNTELASSLCECPSGFGGHSHPQLLLVEVLDDNGQPVPDGEAGELTATTLGVEGMPLVRYRTGDYTTLHRERCPCGLHTPRIGPVIGRKHHKLKLKGTTIFPSTLKAVLDSVEQVVSYALIARKGPMLEDDVEVKIACSGHPDSVCRSLRERFQAEAKVSPVVSIASLDELEQLQMPSGARKRRYFVDLRN
jgi:phenylacetate-CoA ligase